MKVSSSRFRKDMLLKSEDESFWEFYKGVKSYQDASGLDADAFCAQVGVQGVSIEESVRLYATLQQEEGHNVVLFKQIAKKGTRRIPLWKGVIEDD